MEPDADSGDVIGEIPGREHPEEVVVMGGHIDSWDVGQGAQDDGAAIMASLEALALMKKLDLHPRRTLRVAFWVNEENGSRGGEAYPPGWATISATTWRPLRWTAGRKRRADSEPPWTGPSEMALLRQIGRLLDPIGAGEIDGRAAGKISAP